MMVVVGHSRVQLQTGNYRIRLISVGLGYFITVILCRVNWCCNTHWGLRHGKQDYLMVDWDKLMDANNILTLSAVSSEQHVVGDDLLCLLAQIIANFWQPWLDTIVDIVRRPLSRDCTKQISLTHTDFYHYSSWFLIILYCYTPEYYLMYCPDDQSIKCTFKHRFDAPGWVVLVEGCFDHLLQWMKFGCIARGEISISSSVTLVSVSPGLKIKHNLGFNNVFV